MSKLDKNKMYMMPTHFGPHTGPRQSPSGERFIKEAPTKVTRNAIYYETDPLLLKELLPQGFKLKSPVVIVYHDTYENVSWLAGRGYNTLGVSIPVNFIGKEDSLTGTLLTVLWENHGDPIITGREQLGISKIFADITDISVSNGILSTQASSWAHNFFEMKLDLNKAPENSEKLKSLLTAENDGVFSRKYIPKTGSNFTEVDADYITLSPSNWMSLNNLDASDYPDVEEHICSGEMKWHKATWDQMPTQYYIVNKLEALKVKRYLGAVHSVTYKANDLYDQKIVK